MNPSDGAKALRASTPTETVSLYIDGVRLSAHLTIPDQPCGLAVLAYTDPGAAAKPRAAYLARSIRFAGFATLVCDLVGTQVEESGRDVAGSPERLAARIHAWLEIVRHRSVLAKLPVGLIGHGVAGAAALLLAARSPDRVQAVAAIAGRVDLVPSILSSVKCPTILVVGELDRPAARFNRTALRMLRCHRRLEMIQDAHHDFHEPGTVARVAVSARRWLRRYLISPQEEPGGDSRPSLRVIAPDGPLDEAALTHAAQTCAPVAHALRNP